MGQKEQKWAGSHLFDTSRGETIDTEHERGRADESGRDDDNVIVHHGNRAKDESDRRANFSR